MSSRDSILKAIAANQPALKPLPELDLEAVIRYDDQVLQFTSVLQSIGGAVITVDNLEGLKAELLEERAKGNFVINTVEALGVINQNMPNLQAGQLASLHKTYLKGTLAVAENGAIWLYEHQMVNRLIPFICEWLVIVVEKKTSSPPCIMPCKNRHGERGIWIIFGRSFQDSRYRTIPRDRSAWSERANGIYCVTFLLFNQYEKIVFIVALFLTGFFVQAQTEKLSLDKGWRFYQGDIPMPTIKGHGETYSNAKAGKAWGAAAPEFDDTEWRKLNLPHDWSVEQPFDSTENVSQGYRKRGIGWYRRSFKIDPKDRGRHIEIQFDGIATNAVVWFNGTIVHRNWCGYTSFYIDITPFLKYGDDLNKIAIRVDANIMEGWWYEGAGIYRHTWLLKRNPVHIMTDGVFANPIKRSTHQWLIPVETTIENAGKTAEEVEVESVLIDPSGKQIASAHANAKLGSLGKSVAKSNIEVSDPALWWVNQPTLYTVQTTVKKNGVAIDQLKTHCGFRTIKFTADSGFYLNDVWMKLKGTCNHQDHAGVGVAVPNSLWEFRIRKLKEMGSNAFRCAHNPPSKEFLDECDRQGLLVMDENRNFNSSPEYQLQLEWMLRRDRNHPSIILWSVFNEEPMQGTEIGYEMVRRMYHVVKEFDTTRPVTAAMNGGQFSPLNVSKQWMWWDSITISVLMIGIIRKIQLFR